MKLVLDDAESEATVLTWRAASSVASTRLLVVEVQSALARARRGGRLRRGASVAAADARRLLDSVNLIEVEPAIVEGAAKLADRHGLCGYDAVHLASALALGDPEVVVATWDAELAAGAQAEGLAVTAP